MNSCCLTLYCAYSILFNLSNVKQSSLELNSKRLYQSSGKEKGNYCFVFLSSTKREIRHFHVAVGQWHLRKVHKSVMQVQSCYFANLNLLGFLPFSSSLLLLKLHIDCNTATATYPGIVARHCWEIIIKSLFPLLWWFHLVNFH